MTKARILTLCDEMYRKGVPMAALQGILDHVDGDDASNRQKITRFVSPHQYRLEQAAPDNRLSEARLLCIHCGLPYGEVEGKPCRA